MSDDNLVNKSGMAHPHASDIETTRQNSGGHDTNADRSDLRKQSEVYPVNIEKVAQLARFYAAGTPPQEEFRAIKKWLNAGSNELPDKEERRTAQEIWQRGVAHDPRTAGDAFNQRTEIVRERSDFSVGLRALESSIRVSAHESGFKYDRSVVARVLARGRVSRTLALLLFATLIGLASGWQSHRQEAKEMVGRWALSVNQMLSALPATSSELPRREAIAPDFSAAHHGAERSGSQQEQIDADVATMPAVEQSTGSRTPWALLHSREKRAPVPETRPTIIEGWRLREVTNGTAVLEGPNGIWMVKRGDTVPGVGRVESIVRWGKRWIVATSSGLISTP
jgi:hypothetical protein